MLTLALVTSRVDGRTVPVDRCALFVDARYLLAEGARAVHGTPNRESVSWDYPGVLQFLGKLARDRTGRSVLRCYWYEVTPEGRRAPEHDVIADLPGVKLRVSRLRPERREGVQPEIHRDLTTLARHHAISDALLVSAEDDLGPLICDVQDLGVRVTALHITVDGSWTIGRAIRQECDDIVEIGEAHLRPYVELVMGAEPAPPEERQPVGSHAGQMPANGHGPVRELGPQPPLPAEVPPPPPGGYPVPAAQGYQPGPPAGYQPAGAPAVTGQPGAPTGRPEHPQHPQHPQQAQPSGLGMPQPQAPQSVPHAPQPAHPPPPAADPPHPAPGPVPVPAQAGPPRQAGAPRPGQPPEPGQLAAPSPAAAAQPARATPGGYPPPRQMVPAPAEPAARQQYPGAPPYLGTPPPAGYHQAAAGGTEAAPPGQAYLPQHGAPAVPPQPVPGGLLQAVPGGALPGAPPGQVAPAGASLADAVQAAHAEGFRFGQAVARDAPALWLEAVLARKPRMPSDLEARLLQDSALPIDSLLHDEVRHALRRGFWDALERSG
jgi:hypothetical protein